MRSLAKYESMVYYSTVINTWHKRDKSIRSEGVKIVFAKGWLNWKRVCVRGCRCACTVRPYFLRWVGCSNAASRIAFRVDVDAAKFIASFASAHYCTFRGSSW